MRSRRAGSRSRVAVGVTGGSAYARGEQGRMRRRGPGGAARWPARAWARAAGATRGGGDASSGSGRERGREKGKEGPYVRQGLAPITTAPSSAPRSTALISTPRSMAPSSTPGYAAPSWLPSHRHVRVERKT